MSILGRQQLGKSAPLGAAFSAEEQFINLACCTWLRLRDLMNPVGTLETAKAVNPLKQLQKFGQSLWLDYIRRDLLTSGELKRLIEEDGLRGMTSNPAIFEKAIAGQHAVQRHSGRPAINATDLDAKGRYEMLAIRDIQDAADILRPVYDSTKTARRLRQPGSISVSRPRHQGHLDEARRLWKTVDPPKRDDQGSRHRRRHSRLSQQLISEGINVNVTLLFAQEVYEKSRRHISPAWKNSPPAAAMRARSPASPAFSSAASIRWWTPSSAKAQACNDPARRRSCKAFWESCHRQRQADLSDSYRTFSPAPRWKALAAKGAQTQRVLWASTSTKNPNYRDVLYVEELIGPDTVDTDSSGNDRGLSRSWQAARESHRRPGRRPENHGRFGERWHCR